MTTRYPIPSLFAPLLPTSWYDGSTVTTQGSSGARDWAVICPVQVSGISRRN